MRSIITGAVLTIGVVLAGAAGAYTVNAPGAATIPDALITEAQWPPKPRKCVNETSCGNWTRYYLKGHGGPVCKMRRNSCTKYYVSTGTSCKQHDAGNCRQETEDCPHKKAPG